MVRQRIERVGMIAVGLLLFALGLVMLFLPGPGALLILGGLTLLAREFRWASSLLASAKRFFGNVRHWAAVSGQLLYKLVP